jgi:hypothetical protein
MRSEVKVVCKCIFFVLTSLFSVKGKCQNLKPRPKIASILINQLPSTTDDKNSLVAHANLRFPLLLKPNISLFGEVRYRSESLLNPVPSHDASFDQVRLRHYSASLIYKFDIGKKGDLIGNIRIAKQGDRGIAHLDPLLTISSIYRYQLYENVRVGAGFRYQDNFLLPVLFYQHQLNRHLGLSVLLPKEVKLSSMKNNKQLIYASAALQNATYDLKTFDFNNETSTYERLGIEFKVGIEKSLTDWLWVGAYAGLGMPVKNEISGGMDALKSIDLGSLTRPIFGVSLFLVPPSSWMR